MQILIGITGLSGSGKDILAGILTSIAAKYNVQSVCFRLSDEIREVVMISGMNFGKVNRQVLIKIGNHLRTIYGGGILAKLVLERISANFSLNEFGVVIITGIRNPEEVEAFRNKLKEKFVLIAVETYPAIRQLRKSVRNQYEEDANPSKDIDNADEDIGIKTCIEMSQIRFKNDGTKEDLRKQAEDFFDRYMSQ